ncbi:hypothetical protein ACLB2K_031805 [Fragaria x ananassa]
MVALRPGQGSKNNKQASSVSETTGTPRSRQGSQNKKQDSKKPSSSTNESGLPVCLRFNPTDHELVDYYLQSRIVLGDSFHSVVGKTRVDVNKRKTIVDKPKAKRHKKIEIYDEEEDGSSVDDLSMEPQGTSVDIDQPKMEQILEFELDQDHPMLQEVFPYEHHQLHDNQDCYYPELLVFDNPDTSTIDDLLAQTPTCYDNNNFNLVSGGSVQDESDKFLDLLLNS